MGLHSGREHFAVLEGEARYFGEEGGGRFEGEGWAREVRLCSFVPCPLRKILVLEYPPAIELNVRLPSSSIDAVVTKAKDAHAQAPVAIRSYGYGSLKEDDYKTSEQVLGSDGIRTSIR